MELDEIYGKDSFLKMDMFPKTVGKFGPEILPEKVKLDKFLNACILRIHTQELHRRIHAHATKPKRAREHIRI